jgi:hypothetical protein
VTLRKFPDLPARRYPEIAIEVRSVCERYGVAYNTGSFAKQLGGAVRRIFRCALPPRAQPVQSVAAQPSSPAIHVERQRPPSRARMAALHHAAL